MFSGGSAAAILLYCLKKIYMLLMFPLPTDKTLTTWHTGATKQSPWSRIMKIGRREMIENQRYNH